MKKFKDQEILKKIPKFGDSTRIFSFIKIKQKDGNWSKTYPAIVDTGAHTSVIPMSKWVFSDIKLLADYEMRGIVPKKGCYLPVKIGKLNIVICDQSGNFTKEYGIYSFCTLTDKIPLILGFKDLLDKLTLHIGLKEAYIET